MKLITAWFFAQILFISGQDNAQTIISSYLKECYSEPGLLNRNNLPPMSLPVLLDIIKKIEDHPSVVGDLRQISTAIVHLFRQDGIVYDPNAADTPNIVPYSPTGFPGYKNRLLLNKLIPNNQFNMPNDVLSTEDKCALHHMISSSIELHARGDEEWTCNRVELPRSINIRFSQYKKALDVETFDINGAVDVLGRQILGTSRCPMETGVVATNWGPVSMGTVITGISAGMEEQNVLVTDLITPRPGFDNNTIVVNNRYAATIAGDIAEAAVRQGTSGTVIRVGAAGGWNSTNPRRHYFIGQNTQIELTDAEIRGGLDGIILSELGKSYAQNFQELKLSQLIDMYYSANGIMHEARFRVCNRKGLVPDVATTELLLRHSIGPAVALYHVSSLSGTTTQRGLESFVQSTVAAFNTYIPQNIDDPVCAIINDQIKRPKINLILITEPTAARSNMISYLVEHVEVSKLGSSVTFLDSQNGNVLIDKTFSIADFYTEFAKKMVAQAGGLNILNVLQSLRVLVNTQMDSERGQHYSGGHSYVALILADAVPLTGEELMRAIEQANWLRHLAPDLRLVFVTSSASETAVSPLLSNPTDFIPVTLSAVTPSAEELAPAIAALSQMPRRLINPLCGPEWANTNSGTVGFDDYVDADGVIFYRLMPNYFYGSSNTRVVRVQSTDHGPVSVCYSRSNTIPIRNRTTAAISGDVTCESAANLGIVEISLAGACDGFPSTSSCPPLYFSVTSTAIPSTPLCRDNECRYPNDVKFVVTAHELGCFNSAGILLSNKYFYNVFYIIVVLIKLSENN